MLKRATGTVAYRSEMRRWLVLNFVTATSTFNIFGTLTVSVFAHFDLMQYQVGLRYVLVANHFLISARNNVLYLSNRALTRHFILPSRRKIRWLIDFTEPLMYFGRFLRGWWFCLPLTLAKRICSYSVGSLN